MDIRLLNQEIAKNGMTKTDVAKEMGMSEAAFMWKMARGLIGSEEAEKLIRILAIANPAPIFFNK